MVSHIKERTCLRNSRIFESVSLTQIIVRNREQVRRDCRPPNEALHDVFSTAITTATKLRRERWAGYVARKGEQRYSAVFWWEDLKGRTP